MSDCVNVVNFNKDRLRLEMVFEGDDYESATVKFELKRTDHSCALEEPVTIPVRCLFALGYLVLMSIRRTAAEYEKEAQIMIDYVQERKHPFKDIGGSDGKEN